MNGEPPYYIIEGQFVRADGKEAMENMRKKVWAPKEAIYRRAAAGIGFIVQTGKPRERSMRRDYVQVTVWKPDGELDHTIFWQRVKAIEELLSQTN